MIELLENGNSQSHKKIYVLDTSVPMHRSTAVIDFADNDVRMHICSIEELDHLKSVLGKGRAASAASSIIDTYFYDNGIFDDGALLPGGGRLFIDDTKDEDFKLLPDSFKVTNDNRIILLAKKLQMSQPLPVVLVSKDKNLRIKARKCGIVVQDYKSDKKIETVDELYSGTAVISLPKYDKALWDSLYVEDFVPQNMIFDGMQNAPVLFPNQGCFIRDNIGNEQLAIYKKTLGRFNLIHPRKFKNLKIIPRNPEQWIACAQLRDQSIKMLSLVGKGGAGKTILTLEAALEQLRRPYKNIMVFRTHREVGETLGFLPGTLEEKFDPWKKVIYRQLDKILGNPQKNDYNPKPGKKIQTNYDDYLEIAPMNFLQGDTFDDSFIICDEMQNTKPEEIEIVQSRLGRGSKMVLTGDLRQVVRPYVDAVSNGLSYSVMALRGLEFVGHVTLLKSERSDEVEEITKRYEK